MLSNFLPMQKQTDFLFVAATQAKHPGKAENQDAVFALTGRTESDLPYGLFVVADGVGGLQDGHRASQTVVNTLAAYFDPIWPVLTAVSDQTVKRLRQELKKAVLQASSNIQELTSRSDKRMASTVTCAVLLGQALIVANAGDSRTYLYRQKQLEQVTQDHSLVAWLLQQEHITAEQAINHQYQNVLTNALGASEKPQVDLFTQRLFAGDWLLLCSDGIWGTLSDEQLRDYLATGVSPEDLAPELMTAAQDHTDDLSLVLVHLPPPNTS